MSDDSNDMLALWRELAAAASPGPWEDGTASCCPDMGWVDGPKGAVCPVYQGTKATHTLDANDAAFIAAARTAVPWLLDEIERLRRDRDSYANSDFERQLSDERAEVERLRAEVAALVKPWADDVRLSARLAKERAEARAEVERMRPVYEAARAFSHATRHLDGDESWRTEALLHAAVDTATTGDSRE